MRLGPRVWLEFINQTHKHTTHTHTHTHNTHTHNTHTPQTRVDTGGTCRRNSGSLSNWREETSDSNSGTTTSNPRHNVTVTVRPNCSCNVTLICTLRTTWFNSLSWQRVLLGFIDPRVSNETSSYPEIYSLFFLAALVFHGKLGVTMTYPRTLSQKRSLSLHCLFALSFILFQSNVHSSSIFDYLVLFLDSLRPAYVVQIFPGMSPHSSAVSTSDDLKPTVVNSGETVYRPSKIWRFSSAGRPFAWAFTQMHVRTVAGRLCRRGRHCISSFADASRVMIPINWVLHVWPKFTHAASSEHLMDRILQTLW